MLVWALFVGGCCGLTPFSPLFGHDKGRFWVNLKLFWVEAASH